MTTAAFYAMWQRMMTASRGFWIEDMVTTRRNPYARLFFRPSVIYPSAGDGIFIALYPAKESDIQHITCLAGYYHHARPRIGSATFYEMWGKTMLDGFEHALEYVNSRIGVVTLTDEPDLFDLEP